MPQDTPPPSEIIVNNQPSDCNEDSLIMVINDLKQKLVGLNNVATKYPKQIWNSSDVGLPEGIVTHTDCASRGTERQDVNDNYVTVRKPDGTSVIISDIEEDVWLNMTVGDSIK